MNAYHTRTARAVPALAALVLSVATMGVMVGAPVAIDSAARHRDTTATEVAISPATVDVVATRVRNLKVADASSPHVD